MRVRVPESLIVLLSTLSREFGGREVGVWLRMTRNGDEVTVANRYCIPIQVVTYTSVSIQQVPLHVLAEKTGQVCPPPKGVAHIHPFYFPRFSATDWRHLNPYYHVSILVSVTGTEGVDVTDVYIRGYDGPVEVERYHDSLPEEELMRYVEVARRAVTVG